MKFNKSQKEVIRFFLSNGNKPTIPRRVSESGNISVSEKSVGEACKALFNYGILDREITAYITRSGFTLQYLLKSDPDTLRKLIMIFMKDKDPAVEDLIRLVSDLLIGESQRVNKEFYKKLESGEIDGKVKRKGVGGTVLGPATKSNP